MTRFGAAVAILLTITTILGPSVCLESSPPSERQGSFCDEHEIRRFFRYQFNIGLQLPEEKCAAAGAAIVAAHDERVHQQRAGLRQTATHEVAWLKALKWVRGTCYMAIVSAYSAWWMQKALQCVAEEEVECVCFGSGLMSSGCC